MRHIKIGDLEFSKVICGTNPIFARSHFSKARDMEYRARFDDARAEKLLLHCRQLGINAVDSSANERIVKLVSSVREQTGETVRLIGSTRVDATSAMRTHEEKLAYLIENRTDICIIHAQQVDGPRVDGEIAGLDRMLDRIHEAGLLAGISTHRIDTVEYCESRGLPVDTYLFPLSPLDRVYPGWEGSDTSRDRVQLVQSTPKPFILIKVLGAGCVPPSDGIPFVLENAKPDDALCIGFGSEREAEEVVRMVEKVT
jgi:hypothetical protein